MTSFDLWTRYFSGWRLVTVIIMLSTLLSLGAVGAFPGVEGVRLIVSMTARASAIFFCLAFSASALHGISPTPWSRWQLRNRRYLGFAFAGLQTLHVVALISFATLAPASFETAVGGIVIGIFGIAGYITVVALALTSFEPTSKMLGPERWRTLHRSGSYFIWFILAVAFALHLLRAPSLIYANVEMAMLLASLVLRHIPRRRGSIQDDHSMTRRAVIHS
ncbi:hypothetical protein FM996_09720 [Methylosinus sporium]|uniref:Uncharacterized protein n=1 Tax=Methylosinus sporium TaxID=428 RepID=A0A549SXH4_METSR|nr:MULTISPECIES: ferric reductase-like transmembrane domain-containing protein [Methylosinus]MBU3890411.1 ferric reductase-like transmembrane domain-containing protein [Methylosinus sp. KRF6]TRL34332.1 hypothetical protein FM996_09720 [Methylosinus sporium]